MIDSFRGKYYFLSNFYNARVTYKGFTFQNNESAFQSAKLIDFSKVGETKLWYDGKEYSFLDAPPNVAKMIGRRVPLRPDWEEVKYDVMYEIVKAKFIQNPDLKEKLLSTGDEYLVEGNHWGDRTWGQVNGVGKNWLGKILMKVREELR